MWVLSKYLIVLSILSILPVESLRPTTLLGYNLSKFSIKIKNKTDPRVGFHKRLIRSY